MKLDHGFLAVGYATCFFACSQQRAVSSSTMASLPLHGVRESWVCLGIGLDIVFIVLVIEGSRCQLASRDMCVSLTVTTTVTTTQPPQPPGSRMSWPNSRKWRRNSTGCWVTNGPVQGDHRFHVFHFSFFAFFHFFCFS